MGCFQENYLLWYWIFYSQIVLFEQIKLIDVSSNTVTEENLNLYKCFLFIPYIFYTVLIYEILLENTTICYINYDSIFITQQNDMLSEISEIIKAKLNNGLK